MMPVDHFSIFKSWLDFLNQRLLNWFVHTHNISSQLIVNSTSFSNILSLYRILLGSIWLFELIQGTRQDLYHTFALYKCHFPCRYRLHPTYISHLCLSLRMYLLRCEVEGHHQYRRASVRSCVRNLVTPTRGSFSSLSRTVYSSDNCVLNEITGAANKSIRLFEIWKHLHRECLTSNVLYNIRQRLYSYIVTMIIIPI